MAQVVQLRIHGVGGATPEGLLGLAAGSDTIRLAGDGQAGFYARPADPDPHVQGYVWWKLTSGGFAQGLWILLLPFTLFNVGNWMFPPDHEVARWRRPARVTSRFLMFLVGLSLTLAYLLWEFDLVVLQLFYQWGLGGRILSWPGWARAGAGMVGVVLVGGAVYYVARRTRRDFEGVRGPELGIEESEPAPAVLGFPLREREHLQEKFFWAHSRDSRRLLVLHMVGGFLFLGALAGWTVPKAMKDHALGINVWFARLAQAQLALICLLALAYFAGWGLRGKFRFAPPVVVATGAVALTTGFFSGFTLWLGHRLTLEGVALPFDQTASFAITTIAFALCLVGWALYHFLGGLQERRRLRASGDIPLNTRPAGREQDGVTPRTLFWTAQARSFSQCITRIDKVLTPTAFVFVGTQVVFLFIHWEPKVLLVFGAWVLSFVVGLALPALVFRAFLPSANSKVKILWDATTFWPRRWHPFAVRPYAERAVPEIQGRLHHLAVPGPEPGGHEGGADEAERSCVVVAAHSQGAVLAYCALVHLARWEAEDGGPRITRHVALVTFGCPLRQMHARFFPAYFDLVHFLDLEAALFDRPGAPRVAWSNFTRRTDYVGQELFTGTALAGSDHVLPDPPEAPPREATPIDRPQPVPPDPIQPIYTKLMVHSFYNNAVQLREWVDNTVERVLRASCESASAPGAADDVESAEASAGLEAGRSSPAGEWSDPATPAGPPGAPPPEEDHPPEASRPISPESVTLGPSHSLTIDFPWTAGALPSTSAVVRIGDSVRRQATVIRSAGPQSDQLQLQLSVNRVELERAGQYDEPVPIVLSWPDGSRTSYHLTATDWDAVMKRVDGPVVEPPGPIPPRWFRWVAGAVLALALALAAIGAVAVLAGVHRPWFLIFVPVATLLVWLLIRGPGIRPATAVAVAAATAISLTLGTSQLLDHLFDLKLTPSFTFGAPNPAPQPTLPPSLLRLPTQVQTLQGTVLGIQTQVDPLGNLPTAVARTETGVRKVLRRERTVTRKLSRLAGRIDRLISVDRDDL